MTTTEHPAPGVARASRGLRLLAVLPLLLVLAFRGLGPEDLDDNDQAKQALYVLDVYQNGNWILPELRGLDPATKPPLYAWLATGASAALGGPSELACRLPSAIASLLLVLLVFQLGLERSGARVGLAAAWILACSHTLINLSVHVRPDAVLALLVALALFALHRVERGRPRGMAACFWLSLAFSLLAKGPVGLLIALGGVLALALSPQGRARLRPLLRSKWMLSLALPAFWLLFAYIIGGSPYLRETVLGETLDRVLASGTRAGKAVPFGTLLVQFAALGLPWSIFAGLGLARVCSRAGRERWPELVLPVGGFAFGLVLLSLSRGQRSDYLLPMLAPASLVAATLLLDASPPLRRVWRGELVFGGALGVGAGLLALLGRATDLRFAASLSSGLAPAWALAVGCGGAVLLALAARDAEVRPPRLLLAVLALLALHAGYNSGLAPVARAARAPEVGGFVTAVRAAARPEDRLELLGGVSNSVFFLLGRNQPALSLTDIATYDPWAPARGRLLLVSNEYEREALQTRWPGRFSVLLRRSFTHAPGGLALLEDTALPQQASR